MLVVRSHPPGRIAALGLVTAISVCGVLTAPVTGEATAGAGQVQQIDGYVGRLVDSGFSGAVLVAHDGQVVLHEGYGLADNERRLQVTADTVFLVGSITEQFTATAILQLEAEGRLRVTDRIGVHLDGVPPDKAEIIFTCSSRTPSGSGASPSRATSSPSAASKRPPTSSARSSPTSPEP